MPTISVIVPVYNVEKYLAHCLESIRKQDFSDLEIICINDGSTDTSPRLLTIASELDPRILVINQDNRGVSAARNRGLGVASGEIIMFVDGDDFLAPGACKTVAEAFAKDKPDIFTFGGKAISYGKPSPWLLNALSPKKEVIRGLGGDLFKKAKERPYIWLSAFSRDFLETNSVRFEEGLAVGEDQLFYLDAYVRANLIVTSPKPLYFYRANRLGSAMSSQHKDDDKRVKQHLNLADRVFSRWKAAGLFEQYGAGLLYWFLDFISYDAFHTDSSEDALRSVQKLIFKYFGNPNDIDLDTATALALRNLERPGSLLRYPRNLLAMIMAGLDNPVTSSQIALEKLEKLTPLRVISAIYRRIFPASSLMQYWWIAGVGSVTSTAIEDAQSYNRLLSEWTLFRQ